MAIKTGRAETPAEVTIDHDACTLCGLCVTVCPGSPLIIEDGQVKVDQTRLFGCIGCGQCAAVCPQGCIAVQGRTLSEKDITEIPKTKERATYDQLFALMHARRSIRKFKDRRIASEVIERIIEAVKTAPMGIPPSDVEILVFEGREKVQQFGNDIVNLMWRQRWLFGPVGRFLMRPFYGKAYAETSQTFLEPLIQHFHDSRREGKDDLFYDAPLVLYFHVSPYADPVDPLISATYAMLAAESLGLGSCMIGTPAQFLKYSKKLKRKYNIPEKNVQGIAVIFGYPHVKFAKSIKRSIGGVRYY